VTPKRNRTLRAMAHQEAMAAAAVRYLALHDQRLRDGQRDADRRAFIALHGAASALDAALQPFVAGGLTPEGQTLLARIQALYAPRPQHEYRRMIEDLIEPLQAIRDACAAELGPNLGRNRPRDSDAAVFVFIAADAWEQHGHGQPAASERSPFWLALQAAIDADHKLPRLTRRIAADALTRRKQYDPGT
jgi:hypothetical protein